MNCRQNWSEECENELNKQIQREYQASLSYHMLANYFNRDDIGLNKLVKYFNNSSLEERTHADNFMNYQNMRGGTVKLETLEVEKNFNLTNPIDIVQSFEIALGLEKSINESLLGLHKIAEKGLGDLLKSSTLNPIRSEALHHQAKIGTVLLVKNKTNNRSVFIKVVGNCNFEGNKKPIIFLSEKAASIIAMDDITEVEINYAK